MAATLTTDEQTGEATLTISRPDGSPQVITSMDENRLRRLAERQGIEIRQLAWSVTDPGTHSGGVYKGATAKEAARAAARSVWLRGARTLVVRSFAGQTTITRQVFETKAL